MNTKLRLEKIEKQVTLGACPVCKRDLAALKEVSLAEYAGLIHQGLSDVGAWDVIVDIDPRKAEFLPLPKGRSRSDAPSQNDPKRCAGCGISTKDKAEIARDYYAEMVEKGFTPEQMRRVIEEVDPDALRYLLPA